MNFKASANPKFDLTVQSIQMKLNAINIQVHGNWPYLQTDGLFGEKTKQAVKAFQVYRNITPVSGEVGDTTLHYINESYNHVPQISSLRSDTKTYYDTKGISDKYPIVKMGDFLKDVIEGLDDFTKKEMANVIKMGNQSPQALQARFNSFATRFNPQMRRLKSLCQKCIDNQNVINTNKETARTRVDSVRTYQEKQQIRNSQRVISNAQSALKIDKTQAKNISFNIVDELKKFDLMSKIDAFLRSKGLSGEIKLDLLKKFKLQPQEIKINAGTYFKIWAYKDIIADVIAYKEWGTEEWKHKFVKHIYDLLDGIIIGYASAVLAELAVGAIASTAAAVGLTISVGWIAGLVVIVTLAIALLIGYLLNSADVSFSEYAIQGYKSIGELVSALM